MARLKRLITLSRVQTRSGCPDLFAMARLKRQRIPCYLSYARVEPAREGKGVVNHLGTPKTLG